MNFNLFKGLPVVFEIKKANPTSSPSTKTFATTWSALTSTLFAFLKALKARFFSTLRLNCFSEWTSFHCLQSFRCEFCNSTFCHFSTPLVHRGYRSVLSATHRTLHSCAFVTSVFTALLLCASCASSHRKAFIQLVVVALCLASFGKFQLTTFCKLISLKPTLDFFKIWFELFL